jgi:hypothetical protein
MAFDEQNARLRGVKPFPHMVKWIRGDTLAGNSGVVLG